MKLTRQDIEHIARLAQLRLTSEECELYHDQLNTILSYAERLQQVDVSMIPADWHIGQAHNARRPDEIQSVDNPLDVLRLSPWHQPATGYLAVPSVFGEPSDKAAEEENK